jgi:5'-nucleotidase
LTKILLIDQDDTLADFGGELHQVVESVYGLKVPPLSGRDNFNLLETIPGMTNEIMQEIFHITNFYRNLAPLDGAIEALTEIRERGIEAFICTSPIYTNESCASDKISWVREHLGDWWGNRTIITKDKTLIRGDYLIDDKQVIKGIAKPVWEQVVYDQPYNQHLSNHKRINKWKNWKDVIPDILP